MAEISGPLLPYRSIDTPQKQLLRQKISEILTPEIREQCKGLVVTVLSTNEQEIVKNALTEVSERKIRERTIKNNYMAPLTLKVMDPNQE
jgi:hypothetical protein